MAELDRDRLRVALQELRLRGRLRTPQREAIQALAEAIEMAGLNLTDPAHDVATSLHQLAGFRVCESGLAEADFALATGVGKSRLAGAAIELLTAAGISKTFLILSHRDLLKSRWLSALDPLSPNSLVPSLSSRSDVISIESAGQLGGRALNESILLICQTIQTISNARSEWWLDAASSNDIRQSIRERGDLVVIFDESHHLQSEGGAGSWAAAVAGLGAKLILGLTATPRGNRHKLYEYSLARLLREGTYSKRVDFVVASDHSTTDPDMFDRKALEVGLVLLRRKAEKIQSLPAEHPIKNWSPALLVATSSVAEVTTVARRLIEELGVDERRIFKVASRITTDSVLERILNYDKAENSHADIVIAAFMLDEGWDVTRVAVIVPLRALNSIGNSKQIIGRGLRLPAGHRLGCRELDTLSVVHFGQDSLLSIRDEIEGAFGVGAATVSLPDDPIRPDGAEFVPDEEAGLSSTSFLVTLVAKHGMDLTLPRPSPSRMLTSMPSTWHTESLGVDYARIDVGSGSLALDADIAIRGDNDAVIRRVAEKLAYITPAEVAAAVEAWLRDKGGDRPTSFSEKAVESIAAEYLKCCWFEWTSSGVAFSALPPSLNTTSAADPSSPRRKGEPWRPMQWWTGWSKSVYDLTRFDSDPEYCAAQIMDSATDVIWWLRNDPKLVRVSLPTERFSPDFVVKTTDGLLLLEVKGDHLLEGFQSIALERTMGKWISAMRIPSRY